MSDILDEIRSVLDEIKAIPVPPRVRSIHIHPDDVEAFGARANARTLPSYARISIGEPATRGSLGGVPTFGRPASWMVDEIPVYTSKLVPRGRPYIDPPEAAGQIACRAHEDCRAVRELGLACAASRATPQVSDSQERKTP